jgi:hypothetical protein
MPTTLGELASHVRSKNAGPFWVTIDAFFPDRRTYDIAAADGALTPASVAALYRMPETSIQIFRIPELEVIKISFPRRTPQGSIEDRDIHAAHQHIPLLEHPITT